MSSDRATIETTSQPYKPADSGVTVGSRASCGSLQLKQVLICKPNKNVGAGLLAKAVYQYQVHQLTHRIRE
ncbi:hypothetical protein, partial [Pseudomonas sp.]|uniref:hypothetical protein n=1 Tax=Pseudomonas sp. TaxID=306 RepID=UPI003C5CBDB9